MIDRRRFCLTLGALAGTTLLPRRSVLGHLQADGLEVTKIRPGTWVITGGGGNSLLFMTAGGPVLIDTKVAAMGLDVRATAVAQNGAGPALIINTHHHGDHTGGNFAFSGDARIMAHVNVNARMPATFADKIKPSLERKIASMRDEGRTDEAAAYEQRVNALTVDDFLASKRISRTFDYTYGGVDVRIAHFGRAHTDTDLLIYLPVQNVLHTGDLVFHELHPFVDTDANANTRLWQNALTEAVMGLCDKETIVVPGHGALTDITGLERQIEYFRSMRDTVAKARKAGLTRDAVTKLTPFPEYGFQQLRPRTLGTIFDELVAEDA